MQILFRLISISYSSDKICLQTIFMTRSLKFSGSFGENWIRAESYFLDGDKWLQHICRLSSGYRRVRGRGLPDCQQGRDWLPYRQINLGRGQGAGINFQIMSPLLGQVSGCLSLFLSLSLSFSLQDGDKKRVINASGSVWCLSLIWDWVIKH